MARPRRKPVPAPFDLTTLGTLLGDRKTADQVDDLFRQMKKALYERMLWGEMTHHPGYGRGETSPRRCPITATAPRRRRCSPKTARSPWLDRATGRGSSRRSWFVVPDASALGILAHVLRVDPVPVLFVVLLVGHGSVGWSLGEGAFAFSPGVPGSYSTRDPSPSARSPGGGVPGNAGYRTSATRAAHWRMDDPSRRARHCARGRWSASRVCGAAVSRRQTTEASIPTAVFIPPPALTAASPSRARSH